MKTIPAIIQVAHTEGIICVDPIANTPNTPCITHNTKLIADGVIEAIVQHKLNQAYIANILEMIQENAKTIETINEDTKRAIASEFNIFLQQKLSAYTTKDPVMQARIQLARGCETYRLLTQAIIAQQIEKNIYIPLTTFRGSEYMIIPESKYLESVIALCQSTQGAMLKNMEQEYIAPYIGKTLSPSDFFAEEDNLIHFILKQMRVLNKHLLTYDLYTKRLATNDFQYDLSGAHAEFRLRLFSTSQSFTTDANHVQHHAYSKDSASYDIIEGDSLKKPLFLIGPEREKAYNNGTLLR